MIKRKLSIKQKILKNIIELDNSQPELGTHLINFILVQQQFLNLSYLPNRYSYQTILSIISRPQIFISINDTSVFTIIILTIYWMYMIFPLKGKVIISNIGLMMESVLFNFLIETSQNIQYYIVIVIMTITQGLRHLIIEGQLDVQIINFQVPKPLLINKLIKIVMIVQIILNFYPNIQIVATILSAFLNIIRSSVYQQQPLIIIKFTIILNTIALYYAFLIVFQLDYQFSTELILIPLIMMIAIQIVDRMNYKLKYTLNDIQTLIIQQDKLMNQQYKLFQLTNEQFLNKVQKLNPFELKQANIQDQIIYISILMHLKKQFEAMKYIEILLQQNRYLTTNIFKLQRLQAKCYEQIYRKVEFKYQLISSIKDLVLQEFQDYKIHKKMKALIQQKIQFLQKLYISKLRRNDFLNLSQNLLSMKQQMQQINRQFQTEKTSNSLGFFMCQIINDYVSTYQLNHALSQKEKKFNRIILTNGQFTNSMIYLIVEYSENLTIARCSSNTPSTLKIPYEQIINQPIDTFIPNGVKEHHQRLVYQLFNYQHSKFIRNFNENLILTTDNHIQNIDFSLDITYLNDTIQIIVFIEPAVSLQMKMIANQDCIITHISESVETIQQEGVRLIGLNLRQIIPDFQERMKLEDYVTIENVELLKSKIIVTIQVYVKRVDGENLYYLIQIISIKNLTNTQTSFQQTNNTFFQDQSLDEDVIILKPESLYIIEPPEMYQIKIEPENVDQSKNIEPLMSPLSSFIQSPNSEKNKFVQQKYFMSQEKAESQNQDEDIKQDQDNQEPFARKRQGSQTTFNGIQQSQYYKKYELVTKSQELQSFSKSHKIFLSIFIINILIQLLLEIMQNQEISNNLIRMIDQMDFLQVKSLIFQPMNQFLVSRWTIINYNNQYAEDYIDHKTLEEYLVFPIQNLPLGYDDLHYNINTRLNQNKILTVLSQDVVNIKLYIDTSTGTEYQLSVSKSIDILLEYQYTIKMRYFIEGSIVFDSPYAYYNYANYISLYNVFEKINDDMVENSQTQQYQLQDQMRLFMILLIAFLVLFLGIGFIYYIKIEKNVNIYLNMIEQIEKQHISYELARLSYIYEQLTADPNIMQNFQFNIDQQERQFKTDKIGFIKSKSQSLKLSSLLKLNKTSLFFTIANIIIVIYTITSYFLSKQLLDLYPYTVNLFATYADLGVDLPYMFAFREILQNRFLFPYYEESEIEWFTSLIEESAHHTNEFAQSIFLKSDLIISQSFYDYLNELNSNNLCDYQRFNYEICMNALNGNLQRGLKVLLIYLSNQISTELRINNFTNKTNILPHLELEGVFIASEIIKNIKQTFNQDMINETQYLLSTLDVLNICFIVYLIIILILFLYYFKFIYVKEYSYFQHFIYTIPRNTILFDDLFERKLRQQLMIESSEY
ncbi:hypothetical protein pb186bvf_002279 [Paramecium bursaria]